LDQRAQVVVGEKEKKAQAVRELNEVAEQVKYKVYEEDEQKSYSVLQKNYQRDALDDKRAKKRFKERGEWQANKMASNMRKYDAAMKQKQEDTDDLKEKRQDLEQKYKARDAQVARQKEIIAQQQGKVVEKHKMNASDVKQKQQRLDTLKQLGNFRILEKHAAKSRQIGEYNESVQNLSKLV